MFYEIGILAVLGTLLTVGVLGMVGYSARDVDKSENLGQPLFATYILLRGTATVCQRVSKVLDMALMLGLAKFGKKPAAKPSPSFVKPPALSPCALSPAAPSPAKAASTLTQADIIAQATKAIAKEMRVPCHEMDACVRQASEIATAATKMFYDTAIAEEFAASLRTSSSSAPPPAACPSLPDSPVAIAGTPLPETVPETPLPEASDPAVEAMLAAVPRRRRAFPKSNP